MQVQPYLMFDGRCEEALDFYKKAVGAKVDALMRFKEMPPPEQPVAEGCGPPAGSAEKVMHAAFRIGDTMLMASDGMCQGKPSFQGISLSLMARDDADAEKLFAALGDGGQVQMPMAPTFFASRFGMVADRFGVSWMILAGPKG
ncbi:MAG: VOC family protein [Rhodospirillaceae bacterium]|nr:VOC family protein [Rhodospirillaceae bacterium]